MKTYLKPIWMYNLFMPLHYNKQKKLNIKYQVKHKAYVICVHFIYIGYSV